MPTSLAGERRPVVVLRWGDPEAVARYIGDVQDATLTHDGESRNFVAAPELVVTGVTLGGTLDEEQPGSVTIARSRPPCPTLARAVVRHARIRVEVGFCSPGDVNSYERVATLDVDTHSQDAPPGTVSLPVRSLKREMTGACGLVADGYCPFDFGGRGCDYTVPSTAATIASVSGRDVTFSSLTRGTPAATSPTPTNWFYKGTVTVDGLSLGVVEDLGSGNTLTLGQNPPPEWAGQTAVVRAGCGKTHSDCVSKWDNETRFAGIGISMQLRNPIIDEEEL